ncbi:class I SAM-dependent methyltransferase [Nonomuraea soli]|uniref:SAM-dependent methyltransferase n=1 Tax=Nonomuraea soli TaxID=1032476 RepID=A0A7W0CQW7_9ACTN|nr:class I SAM-dependent methyltransferase [Nonomuraea soli]MBA2895592.1 SAM-dependent methyltransferase [Nonomuraea soli]
MERVRKLLDVPGGDSSRGYLDLLGTERVPLSFAQRLMQSTQLPLIYERLWRPYLIGLSKGGPFGPSTVQEMAMLHDMLRLAGGEVILDVACGPGNVTRALAPGADLVVGIDASATMLDTAVRDTRDANVEYVRGDAVSLPFSSQTFDAVACFAALYLFDRPFDALDSMARVLRPGGRLALMTTRRVPGLEEIVRQVTGVRLFADDEVTGALTARGFTDVAQRTSGFIQYVEASR